jgi:hypothetical protein
MTISRHAGGDEDLGSSNGELSAAGNRDVDLTPASDRQDCPPLLDLAVPLLILMTSGLYAWSLRDMANPESNLLLLKPLFIAIWLLLAGILLKGLVPTLRAQRVWSRAAGPRRPLANRFAPGTELGAGLVVAATFAFAFGPGHGPVIYLISAFLYLLAVGYLIGDRKPFWLIGQAALLSAGLYLIMGILLGVSL